MKMSRWMGSPADWLVHQCRPETNHQRDEVTLVASDSLMSMTGTVFLASCFYFDVTIVLLDCTYPNPWDTRTPSPDHDVASPHHFSRFSPVFMLGVWRIVLPCRGQSNLGCSPRTAGFVQRSYAGVMMHDDGGVSHVVTFVL